MKNSELEKRFNALTPDWIVSTSQVREELGNKQWDIVVPFHNTVVHKASPISINGEKVFVPINTNVAIPDFIILNTSQFSRFSAMLTRAQDGLSYVNPFKEMGCNAGFYIELLGEYYHTGEYVQGSSKEEHEKEIIKAYESSGNKVLILWENDVWDRWEEFCIPKIKAFLEEIDNDQIWGIAASKTTNTEPVILDVWKSLSEPSYWRSLETIRQNDVVEKLCNMYQKIDYPFPDAHLAKLDYLRFMDWASKTRRKGTRFGSTCSKHFAKSMIDAQVKGQKSFREIWNDKELMTKAIVWQFTHEDGSHHAMKFVNAMCHIYGFRIITNQRPDKIVMWLDKYAKPSVGKIFYDPCAGWGGRMLAAHALKMKYRAIDANKTLVNELNTMAKFFDIDAVVIHGDSSDKNCVDTLLQGEKADIVFTSPPYFDEEIYSQDSQQSIIRHPTKEDWYSTFMVRLITNAKEHLSENGVFMLNVDKNFKIDHIRAKHPTLRFNDFDVRSDYVKGVEKERLIGITKQPTTAIEAEGVDFVTCQICHRRFNRLKKHLQDTHKISSESYLLQFPNANLISEKDSQRVSDENRNKKHKSYTKRVVYRLPSGSYCRKRDAWVRAWNGNPPEDGIIDAQTVDLEAKGIEGMDYVKCVLCGFTGSNIKRHVKKEHELSSYSGLISCQKTVERSKIASAKIWGTRGRIAKKKDVSQNKTHKKHGITKEVLDHKYVECGMSDTRIGLDFGLTGEGVAYLRKKFGIATRLK